MNLRNSTDLPDYFIRRMVRWCAKQVECNFAWVKSAKFHNTKNSRKWSGCGGRGYIRVGILSREFRYVNKNEQKYGGVKIPDVFDRLEALVAITAHELRHVQQFAKHRIGILHKYKTAESDAMQFQVASLQAFRADREKLLAAWNEPPAEKKKPDAADKARAMLDRWERKLKAAQNKVRKYRTRVRYYERKQAAAASPKKSDAP